MKNNLKQLIFLSFLIISTALGLALLSQNQSLKKRAQAGPIETSFGTQPAGQIKRIWNYFSQGGEEKGLMLKPAAKEIKKLQPSLIRIDHIFDFPSLDERVEEIISLGATPFLSLSYFPPSISNDPVGTPNSYQEWENLVAKTIQRYSGKTEKNLWNVYYEVWNEPDLFGKMDPNTYFNLYKASAQAASRCQSCNPFKLGGPAITTLKKSWMENFLNQVFSQNLRLDFVSWHSYQVDAKKTQAEAETLKSLANLSGKELIVSEWGSTPEISSIHDSYFDACHTISAVSLLKNSLDKIMTFELVDGPSPEQKKYWGRWGLLTNESFGLTPKPKYYSFLYLNKMLEYELPQTFISPLASAIASTDGKENFAIIVCQSTKTNTVQNFNLKLNYLPPGIYTTNTFSLFPNKNPLLPLSSQASFNGGEFKLNLPSSPDTVHLVEISRQSPALLKSLGRTNNPNDFSAKITSFLPSLVFPINFQTGNDNLKIDFWFKPNWSSEENLKHVLLEDQADNGSGFSVWVENANLKSNLHLASLFNSKVQEEIITPLLWDINTWHHLVFYFDNQNQNLSLKVDDGQNSNLSLGKIIPLGNRLYVGSDSFEENSAEGSIDDLIITLNNQPLYNKDFNQTPVPTSE